MTVSNLESLVPLRVLVPAHRRDLATDGPRVSVVVPTLNESRNLPWLAQHMPANLHELIIVDGNSTDGTPAVARRLWPDARIIGQTRRGKGNALACGFYAATGDIIVMIDADGSMDPGEIPFFVDALVAGADYAKGSRFISGAGSDDITRVRAAGNKVLNKITNVGHGTRYSDLCYGYNAFWRYVTDFLDLDPGTSHNDATERLWGDGFEIETLINIRVHNAGLVIAEVPSFESERLHGVSNLNAVSDGIRVLKTIATERRRKVAAPPQPELIEAHEGNPLLAVDGVTGEHERGHIPDVEEMAPTGRRPVRVSLLPARSGEAHVGGRVIDLVAAERQLQARERREQLEREMAEASYEAAGLAQARRSRVG